jgi:hypothetical protein
MRRRLILVLLGTSILSGCSAATARLYPAQGPLTTLTPSAVFIAKVSGMFSSGNFSAVLTDGEKCKGRWELVRPPKAPQSATAAGAPAANDLSAAWDIVYGPGFYTAHVLGAKQYARAAPTCNQGLVLNVEMLRPDNVQEKSTHTLLGVAKDSKNNVYKLVF